VSTRLLALIALVEAAGLLVYGGYEAVQGVLVGATGPAEVSNVPAIILQVVIFAVLGVGMVYVGRGWLQRRRWARAPFILAQLIGLLVGIPIAQTAGAAPRISGIALTALAIAGIVVALTPAVTRALQEPRD
jgi:Na+-driven multidrug efflux pump